MMIKKLFEDFISNEWNLYGMQAISVVLIFMILRGYLGFSAFCVIGLCVYLIAFSQRLLGVRVGMLFYDSHQDKVEKVIDEIHRLSKEKAAEIEENNKMLAKKLKPKRKKNGKGNKRKS